MMKIGVFANPYKKFLVDNFSALLELIARQGVEIFCPQDLVDSGLKPTSQCQIMIAKEIPGRCDMIFCFGGDGTVLRTVQVVRHHQTPILTINVGGLGFLTEVMYEDFEKALKSVLAGDYQIEERLLLQGRFAQDENPMIVLNEITVEKGRSTRVIEVRVEINGRYFNDYVADGLIISTPTGSTGYSLSSGGPIVVPTNNCIILNPICPHSLTNRPVIIPAESVIRTQIFTDYPQVIISGDNQDIREVPSRTVLDITRAPFNVRLIKYSDSDYFTLLRNKLAWGEDFRNKLRWSYNR
jgi:NAD+ kinase